MRQRADLAVPWPLFVFAWTLRRGCGRVSQFALTNQHQISNVNQRVWQISQNSYGVAPEDEVRTHDDAAADAPVPKRNRDYTLSLFLRGVPLHKETHRKRRVSNQADDHEIIPVQTKEPMFLAEPCHRDND